jgi:hypothetical protein
MARGVAAGRQFVFRFLSSRVVVPFYYLGEVRLALWTCQAAFVAVPLVLALVAEDDVALGRIHGCDSFARAKRVLCEIASRVSAIGV